MKMRFFWGAYAGFLSGVFFRAAYFCAGGAVGLRHPMGPVPNSQQGGATGGGANKAHDKNAQ